MLVIKCSKSFINERLYIFKVIFKEFFGIKYRVVCREQNFISITDEYDNKRHLFCSDILFKVPTEVWLTKVTLPQQPLKMWQVEERELANVLVRPKIPVIYGKLGPSGRFLSISSNEIRLGVDIFGAAFFMLTRYEEAVILSRDCHNRFEACSSLAYQEGFLERPIINEYLEVLWWTLKKLWPWLVRKKRQFRVMPTHDVDWPFAYALLPMYKAVRCLAGDLLVRRDWNLFKKTFLTVCQVKTGELHKDPYFTFDEIMQHSEKHGHQSCFYFMTEHINSKYDTFYPFKHKYIKDLMQKVHVCGHSIGIHPSYETYDDCKQIRQEYRLLLEECEAIKINQRAFGGRQHFLRWQADTWQYYSDADISYDSTLLYADHLGFRCGVCFEYPVYNLKERKQLALYEKPPVFMDMSIFSSQYMNLTGCAS